MHTFEYSNEFANFAGVVQIIATQATRGTGGGAIIEVKVCENIVGDDPEIVPNLPTILSL